jgi:hypothetical protein
MSNEKIIEELGLAPLNSIDIVPEEKTEIIIPNNEIQEDLLKDIEKSQNNIDLLLDQGKDSLTELISLAKQSQSVDAFDTITKLIKTLSDVNKDYIAVSEKKKYAKEDSGITSTTTNNVTNNNLILTTADVLKMFKGEK